jgi:hypothetical protein
VKTPGFGKKEALSFPDRPAAIDRALIEDYEEALPSSERKLMYFDNPDPRLPPDTMRSMRRSIIFHLKSWRVFVPIGEVSLRSALLAAAPGGEDTQAVADSLLEGMGEIEETLSRFTGTPPEQVVYCGVSSSMVSGCWGLFEPARSSEPLGSQAVLDNFNATIAAG